jgi:uncharacterized protein
MQSYSTTKLLFNLGFLLDGTAGQSTSAELDYPGVLLDDLLLAPLQGYFRASRSASGIYISGEMSSQLPATCARCNTTFDLPVTIPLDDHFYLPQYAPEGEFVVRDDGIVDIGALVREQALLAFPIQPVCRPDCHGLCIECGTNLNTTSCDCDTTPIDPRLSILARLLEENREQGV